MYEGEWEKNRSLQARAEKVARGILGVEEGVSADDVKAGWRRECKKYHPDRSPGDPEAEERFKLIRLSYLCLRYGKRCGELVHRAEGKQLGKSEGESSPASRWSYFLSWRDRFF